MPTLKETLEKDKEKIKSLCEKFGYTNVRVYCDPATPALQLVVSENSTDEQYQAGLEAILLEELGCKASVMVDSQIDPIYLADLLEKSASIDKLEVLKEKFGMELSEVNIEIFSESEKSYNFDRALDLANEVLGRERVLLNNSSTLYGVKQNGNGTTREHASSKRSPNDSSEDANAKKSKVDDLTPNGYPAIKNK